MMMTIIFKINHQLAHLVLLGVMSIREAEEFRCGGLIIAMYKGERSSDRTAGHSSGFHMKLQKITCTDRVPTHF